MGTRCVRGDNGPEFTGRAFMAWAQARGIRHILIEPRRSMHNGYRESFNGKFRDERLNEHWLQTLARARNSLAKLMLTVSRERYANGKNPFRRRSASSSASASVAHCIPVERTSGDRTRPKRALPDLYLSSLRIRSVAT